MTTISNLSKEILILIFEKLEKKDLEQCQHVCHAWYPPAHRVSLYDIELLTRSAVERFIACIDMNPIPFFLTAVKTIFITIDEEDTQHYNETPVLGKENIKKLFFRFHNLKEVTIDASFNIVGEFDDEIIDMFLNNCPKLETFDFCDSANEDYQMYLYLLDRLRRLQTTVDITEIKEVEDVIPFLADFPRLQAIADNRGYFGTFEKWFPLLEQAHPLSTLSVNIIEDDKVGFAEKYLMTKTREQQHHFINQLSKINTLYLTCGRAGNFLNSLQFVAKYFTGLSTISINCTLYENTHNTQQLLTINTLLDFPVNKRKRLQIKTTKDNLFDILPLITNKVFYQPASTVNMPNRVLELNLVDFNALCIDLITHQSPSEQRIMITACPGRHLFLGDFFQLDNVDEFKFEIPELDDPGDIDVYFYDCAIDPFTSLKKIHFDVPSQFQDDPHEHHKIHKIFPLMQEATLRVNPDSTCQALLDRCFYAFPNLQRLNLHQFSGIWKEHTGEFQVELGKYTLQCLTVDVTPVRNKCLKDDFFVVEVEALQSNERHLYKVQIDLSLVTLIDDSGLNGLICGEDYCKIHVTIKSLQNLQLVLDNRTGDSKNNRALDLTNISRINLFDKVSS